MKIQNYFTLDKYVLTTKLSSQEVYARIAENIEQLDYFRFEFITPSYKKYEGEIFKDGFKIRKIDTYRNSLMPLITGFVSTFLDETQINIKIRPSTWALIFNIMWFGILGTFCSLVLFKTITNQFNALYFFLGIAVLVFWTLIFISRITGFRRKSKNLEEFVIQLLDAKKLDHL